MKEPISSVEERLAAALAENEQLRSDKLRLQQELARLRGLMRSGGPDSMSTRLKDALRE
ncbi:hypothetical protein [Paenibacillus sp. R14(2021)]|uniref:hypothetical protein n=1 Tax=Paenibacillus sp. R14(2021) TaxID=2859228 RepID=UPI001C616791|nr:hypothetical protein [Paenibacillus sp. R14(2021)]